MLAAIPVRALFARLFSLVFFVLAFTLVSATVMDVISDLQSGQQLMQALIKGVNGSIIALAVYELAMVIRSEYSGRSESHDVITMILNVQWIVLHPFQKLVEVKDRTSFLFLLRTNIADGVSGTTAFTLLHFSLGLCVPPFFLLHPCQPALLFGIILSSKVIVRVP